MMASPSVRSREGDNSTAEADPMLGRPTGWLRTGVTDVSVNASDRPTHTTRRRPIVGLVNRVERATVMWQAPGNQGIGEASRCRAR